MEEWSPRLAQYYRDWNGLLGTIKSNPPSKAGSLHHDLLGRDIDCGMSGKVPQRPFFLEPVPDNVGLIGYS